MADEHPDPDQTFVEVPENLFSRTLPDGVDPMQTLAASEMTLVEHVTFCADATLAEGPPAGEQGERISPPQGFDVHEEIGRGAMGVVYRASQRPLTREVALKTLRPEGGDRERCEFISEALISGGLDHPNIVPIYDLEEDDQGSIVLAMKLIDGVPWSKLLHPGPALEERARELTTTDHLETLLSVCNAVSFAHSRKILHRDLKPENVMIGEFGEVFLTDWGIAISFAENPQGIHRARHKDQAMYVAGTPVYMAPEMVAGNGPAQGPWTDVYLLGAILYEILIEKAPHSGPTLSYIMEAAKVSNITWPDDRDIPLALRSLCDRAMAADPSDRFQTVTEFSDALRDYLKNSQSLTISTHSRRQLRKVKRQVAKHTEAGTLDGDACYREYFDVISGFNQALLLWPENGDALTGRADAKMSFAELAFRQEDYRLARAQAGELQTEEATELLKRIEQALAEQEQTAKANRKLRRALLTSAVLVGGLVLSMGFALYSTRELGHSISDNVGHMQVMHALESLKNDHADVSARTTQLNIHKAELALQVYRDAVRSAFRGPVPDLTSPVYMKESVDTGVDGPPGLQHLDTYEYVDEEGNRIHNPVTFEAQTFYVSEGTDEEEAARHIARIQQTLPVLQELQELNTQHIIRYFAGFENGVYVAYPGHGNMPNDYDHRIRPWYKEGLKAEGKIQTRPYTDASSRRLVVSFLEPLRDQDGTVMGVAGVDINMSNLIHVSKLPEEWVKEAQTDMVVPREENGRRWLEFKAREDQSLSVYTDLLLTSWDAGTEIIEDDGSESFEQIFTGMRNRQTGVIKWLDEGIPTLSAFSPLGIDNTFLLISLPEQAVVGEARAFATSIRDQAGRHILQLASVVAVMLAVVGGIAWLGMRKRTS